MRTHVCVLKQPPAFNSPRFLCLDCSENTARLDEYYMVHRAVWSQAVPTGRGMLCIGCLESRLGRELTPTDFTDAPLNQIQNNLRSPRLIARLGFTWP